MKFIEKVGEVTIEFFKALWEYIKSLTAAVFDALIYGTKTEFALASLLLLALTGAMIFVVPFLLAPIWVQQAIGYAVIAAAALTFYFVGFVAPKSIKQKYRK